ncbi:hypothetical protein PVAG01_07728 [Phlyctema vagabunda]|uniref:Uncharacterized protein n=1 Tax=Phlyctema vagabunda TaxID=108571 RepID=A0ABR4PDB2_9HELO
MSADPTQPTQKEAFFFLSILSCQKTKPDVDWNVVAQKNGYSNANCAKVRFGQIKRRLGYNEDSTGSGNVPATPKKNGSGGRKAQPKKSGSGTNGTAAKVKKSPTKPRSNDKVSKAEFAEAAYKHALEEEEYETKMQSNLSEDDQASSDYDHNDHSNNINFNSSIADEEGDMGVEDTFYDANDEEANGDNDYYA